MHRFAMRPAMVLGADELRVGSWADKVGDANSIDTMSPRPRTSNTCGPITEFRRNSFRKPNSSWDLTPQIIRPRNRTTAPLGPSRTEIAHCPVCPPLSLRPQRLFPQRKQPHCQHRYLPGVVSRYHSKWQCAGHTIDPGCNLSVNSLRLTTPLSGNPLASPFDKGRERVHQRARE